ncbi:tyrosine-type recombinase/integrase [Sporosarcina highlanderae]|uniref:Tyr recombinase domain-containing protein n=1 Tax=Sporosarcina highlanderae TaxID=3035916 RepID=A0ABT8JQG4_9BACL|nr:tyrosine-type recombinase/integrase [Sporosarcina highlanderae]MDN4607374.1 hypothetical protein [Sporosarcina highlanderae]
MIGVYGYKNYLDVRNKAIITMLADTGMRAGEIRGLKPDDIKENTILIKGKWIRKELFSFLLHLKKSNQIYAT